MDPFLALEERQLLQIIHRFSRTLERLHSELLGQTGSKVLACAFGFLATLRFNLLTPQGKLGCCLSLMVALELADRPGLLNLAPCSVPSGHPLSGIRLCVLVPSPLPWPKPLQSGLPRANWPSKQTAEAWPSQATSWHCGKVLSGINSFNIL